MVSNIVVVNHVYIKECFFIGSHLHCLLLLKKKCGVFFKIAMRGLETTSDKY